MSDQDGGNYIGMSERGCKLCIDCPKGVCLHDCHTQKTVGGESIESGFDGTGRISLATTEEGWDKVWFDFCKLGGLHSTEEAQVMEKIIDERITASYTRGREEGLMTMASKDGAAFDAGRSVGAAARDAELKKIAEKKMDYYYKESKKHLDNSRELLAYDDNSRYIALKHFIEENLSASTPKE